MPRSVAATRIAPSEQAPTAKRIVSPAPPALKLWRHAQHRRGAGIETRTGIEAGRIQRIGDAALRQRVARTLRPGAPPHRLSASRRHAP
jgi:hypothetical protein